jgi:hypothetical protein
MVITPRHLYVFLFHDIYRGNPRKSEANTLVNNAEGSSLVHLLWKGKPWFSLTAQIALDFGGLDRVG